MSKPYVCFLRKTGHARKTLRRAVDRRTPQNPNGAHPYIKQKSPSFDPRIRKQRKAYASHGLIAKLIEDGEWETEKRYVCWADHTPCAKNGSPNRSHDPSWLTKEDRDREGVPAAGSSKFTIKPQVYLFTGYDMRYMHEHVKRKRKKRHLPNSKREYRLELESVNGTNLAQAVEVRFLLYRE